MISVERSFAAGIGYTIKAYLVDKSTATNIVGEMYIRSWQSYTCKKTAVD